MRSIDTYLCEFTNSNSNLSSIVLLIGVTLALVVDVSIKHDFCLVNCLVDLFLLVSGVELELQSLSREATDSYIQGVVCHLIFHPFPLF